MATVDEITRRVLRLLGVIDPSESPSASDSETTIVAMNAMVRRWEANGMALGWQDVSNPTQRMPCPDEALEAIAYQLALRLAPEYQIQPNPMLAEYGGSSMRQLRRDRMVEMPIVQTLDTPLGYRTGKYDTLTDTWRL